jgi:hypothetical protein
LKTKKSQLAQSRSDRVQRSHVRLREQTWTLGLAQPDGERLHFGGGTDSMIMDPPGTNDW